MSEWKDFPRDFAARSRINVEKYSGEYEVTNLINNCLGLIVIPKELNLESLPIYKFAEEDHTFGINKKNIEKLDDSNYSLLNVLRHIRNGLSHGLIDQRTENGDITAIRIWDRENKQSPGNFSITLTIDELKKFSFSIADFLFQVE